MPICVGTDSTDALGEFSATVQIFIQVLSELFLTVTEVKEAMTQPETIDMLIGILFPALFKLDQAGSTGLYRGNSVSAMSPSKSPAKAMGATKPLDMGSSGSFHTSILSGTGSELSTPSLASPLANASELTVVEDVAEDPDADAADFSGMSYASLTHLEDLDDQGPKTTELIELKEEDLR